MADYECPYDYLLSQYGQHHFQPFVDKLRPSLNTEDPVRYALVLDIMDAVHFCAILVDDIADGSLQRRNKAAAHVVFGATETSNRAYLVLMRVINRAMRENPVLATELLKSLQDIHLGQDESLQWRRHGLEALPHGDSERLAAYQLMAQHKTGSLFVLLGRLLNDGGTELDEQLQQLGWYAQLQNDCKNIYSAEYAHNKGSTAEDLRNGEISYPMMVGLTTDGASSIIEKALETRSDVDIDEALEALESPAVRMKCMEALKEASHGVEDLIALWGRRETMTSASESTGSTQDGDMASVDTMTTAEPTHELSAADVAHWDQLHVPMLTSLLESCGVYSPADRDAQIRFVREHVLPSLGPRPLGAEPQIVPMVSFSGLPLQPSINLSGTGIAKVRYLFEPLDALSGLESDPFATGAGKRMLRTFADHLGVWTGWMETLMSAYHPTPEEVQQVRPKLGQFLKDHILKETGQAVEEFPHVSRLWLNYIALDLDGPSQAMKAYFNPLVKEAATGIPTCSYAFKVLRGMEGFGNDTSIDMLEQFFAERNRVGVFNVVAVDCVPENMQPSARVKLYAHIMSNSFKTVRDHLTLGGRLTDHATLEGLGRLRSMWHLLMGEPDGINDEEWEKPLGGICPLQHRLYISYEVKAGNSPPAVKIYIPAQSYAPDDDAIVRNYEEIFRQCGWPWGKEGAYRNVVESAFGPLDQPLVPLLHEFSSFNFAPGKGVYQSIYYSGSSMISNKTAKSEWQENSEA